MSIKGTAENPWRILVSDNWGAGASVKLKGMFPNITFSVHTEAKSSHPHGHMVAECICHMLPKDAHAEIVFYPHILIQRFTPEDAWLDVIAKAREDGKPFDVCNCSFGITHDRGGTHEKELKASWLDGTRLKSAMQKIGDTLVFFAAGNSDHSRRGTPDMYNDVNYPQKPLSALANVYVIGACNYESVPSLFSSDGTEIFSMYWGEDVYLYDPVKSDFSRVDGTSFASPLATGDVVRLMHLGRSVSKDAMLNYVLDEGTVAKDWVKGARHRKAGYGCMMKVIKKQARMLVNRAEGMDSLNMPLAYHDFTQPKPKKSWFRRG